MFVSRRGAEIPKRVLAPADVAALRRELTVAPNALNQPFPQKFKVYQETPDAFVVPVQWARKWERGGFGGVGEDGRGSGIDVTMRYTGALRQELRQHEAAAAVQDAWTRTGGATLCLPVGFGKTQVALYLAATLKKKTLVVVHTSLLADQWVARVQEVLGPGTRVGKIQGSTCDVQDKDVVVAMIQTLVSRKHAADVFSDFGLLIVDEAHHVGAKVFSQAMFGLCFPRTLGLTATPDRADGLTRLITWFLGDIAFRLKRENQTSTRVECLRYTCDAYAQPQPVNRRGDICSTSVITHLVNDAARTDVIARRTSELAAMGRHVLVLSHRCQHCDDLALRLRQLGCDAATYTGRDKQRKAPVPESRVIVATYSLTSEGFDLPRLDALVMATPRSNVEQSCGRVMRGSSAADAILVDVVDHWGICIGQHAKRRRYYKDCGFVVTHPAGGDDTPGGDDDEVTQCVFAFDDIL
jgi:superfamily II DNA or RNA helicase